MSDQKLNLYDDVYIPTTGAHGGNIAQQRMDALDTECVKFIDDLLKTYPDDPVLGVDLGGGVGAQCKRMADHGADVLLIDLTDQSSITKQTTPRHEQGKIRFLQSDVRHVPESAWPKPIDCIYSQRALHYLCYADCLDLLKLLRKRARSRTRLFLSMGGINTEYGVEYSARHLPIEMRFGRLSDEMSAKHGIHVMICLYSMEELIALARMAGFVPERAWLSEFGSPKLIASI